VETSLEAVLKAIDSPNEDTVLKTVFAAVKPQERHEPFEAILPAIEPP
jgi:hypothetical protein